MYPNLRAEMARRNITSEAMAKALNLNPATMSVKLNRYDRIKLCECYTIKKMFFPDKEISYLFATEAPDTGQRAS